MCTAGNATAFEEAEGGEHESSEADQVTNRYLHRSKVLKGASRVKGKSLTPKHLSEA